MALAAEADRWGVDELTDWYRQEPHSSKIRDQHDIVGVLTARDSKLVTVRGEREVGDVTFGEMRKRLRRALCSQLHFARRPMSADEPAAGKIHLFRACPVIAFSAFQGSAPASARPTAQACSSFEQYPDRTTHSPDKTAW